jgi:hypothetical protein
MAVHSCRQSRSTGEDAGSSLIPAIERAVPVLEFRNRAAPQTGIFDTPQTTEN